MNDRSMIKQLPLDFAIRNEFSFMTFVTSGRSIELIDTLKNIADSDEQFYYIWGDRGVGKTHLLHSVCHDNEQSAYVPLEKLQAVTPAVFDGLDAMKIVCLDNVEAVLGDRDREARLFVLFNNLRERGGKLLVTASRPPRRLETVLPDLASRLSWGVVYQLQELDDQGKSAALRSRAHHRGFQLGDDVLNYILQRNSRSTGSLFAVLDRLDQLSLAEQRKITIPFIRDIMQW